MAVGRSLSDVVVTGNEEDVGKCVPSFECVDVERGAECARPTTQCAASVCGSTVSRAMVVGTQRGQKQQQQHSRVRLVECGTLVGGPSGLQGNVVQPRGRAEAQHLNWARTPTGQWMRVLSSTAISGCPNRERDKERVESTLGLPEFGDNSTEFYAVKCGLAPIAMGYDRIVYGDHGPYVELSPEHVCWPTFQSFVQKPEISFYDEFWTCDGSTMLYAQKRPVLNKPNPPCGPYAVQNNRREGYANYLGGKYYLSADADTIAVRCVRLVRRRRRRACRGKAGSELASHAGDEAESCPDDEEAENEDPGLSVEPPPYAGAWDEMGSWSGWSGDGAWIPRAWDEATWQGEAWVGGEWQPTSAEHRPSRQGAQGQWVQKLDLGRLEPPALSHDEACTEVAKAR